LQFANKYEILGKLGDGQYGAVVAALDLDEGDAYAMKTVKLTEEEEPYAEFFMKLVKQEVKMQELVKSNNIVRVHKTFKKDGAYVIMTELMPDGELKEKILRKEGGLDDGLDVRDTLRQIVTAVKFMHDLDVVHLDIKPENIWFKDKVVKIGDFTCAMDVRGKLMELVPRGSLPYMAPELVQKMAEIRHHSKKETPVDLKKADIWSLGVTFYQVLAGKPPWRFPVKLLKIMLSKDLKKYAVGLNEEYQTFGEGNNDIFDPLPDGCSVADAAHPELCGELNKLILQMLEVDPEKRLTIEQVANHKYFTGAAAYEVATDIQVDTHSPQPPCTWTVADLLKNPRHPVKQAAMISQEAPAALGVSGVRKAR
jgi:serine/threonine protein kinase